MHKPIMDHWPPAVAECGSKFLATHTLRHATVQYIRKHVLDRLHAVGKSSEDGPILRVVDAKGAPHGLNVIHGMSRSVTEDKIPLILRPDHTHTILRQLHPASRVTLLKMMAWERICDVFIVECPGEECVYEDPRIQEIAMESRYHLQPVLRAFEYHITDEVMSEFVEEHYTRLTQ